MSNYVLVHNAAGDVVGTMKVESAARYCERHDWTPRDNESCPYCKAIPENAERDPEYDYCPRCDLYEMHFPGCIFVGTS